MATPSPTTPPATPLKYSDYAQGASIVTGTIGAYSFFASAHPELAGYFLLATTIFAALSQWLQSKGD